MKTLTLLRILLVSIFLCQFLHTNCQVIPPPHFDGTDHPTLRCDQKINPGQNIQLYMTDPDECLDGYLLDSAYWKAHPLEADIYPDRRLPKVFGWNCIADTTHPYLGHPNPSPIYYPKHTHWLSPDSVCWGPDQHILWLGTGWPRVVNCTHLEISYDDVRIDLSVQSCDGGPVSCYTLLRQWSIYDSCKNEQLIHTQVIKMIDDQGPEILYPDTIILQVNPANCLARWEVSPPWLSDNCSVELHYELKTSSGNIIGNEIVAYIVTNLVPGNHTATFTAFDCCGNKSVKDVVLVVRNEAPPVAVCKDLTVNMTGNQAPGLNTAMIPAVDLDQGSSASCDTVLFFKAIRLSDLKGTKNGTDSSLINELDFCHNFNGDDNDSLDGNQIYFDDRVYFCCEDVGHSTSVILRVFDIDPGPGPVHPSRMDPGGDLYNHFSDCLSQVLILDRSIPTLVSPSNVVASCHYSFDVKNLSDPNDSTFGRIVTSLSNRGKITTTDIVCHAYCVDNKITGYPGYIQGSPPSNPPASNRACDYYRTLFDTAHPFRKYEMVWGFDGYALSACDVDVSITVEDLRVCGKGRINRRIRVPGPTGAVVTATQTIWIVDCDNANPSMQIQLDSTGPTENGFADVIIKAITDNICYPADQTILSYEIDEFNDSSGVYPEGFDYKVGPLNLVDFNAGIDPLFMDNPRAFDSKNPSNASGRYPVGIHKIRWTASDTCGSVRMATLLFEIKETVGTQDFHTRQNLSIIPNPSKGSVLIRSSQEIDFIRIVFGSGIILRDYFVPDKHHLKVDILQAGMYFIQAYNQGKIVSSEKLIVH